MNPPQPPTEAASETCPACKGDAFLNRGAGNVKCSACSGTGKTSTTGTDKPTWIPWDGGECPVPKGAVGQLMFSDGGLSCDNTSLFTWNWSHAGTGSDIIAYRYTSKISATAKKGGDEVCPTTQSKTTNAVATDGTATAHRAPNVGSNAAQTFQPDGAADKGDTFAWDAIAADGDYPPGQPDGRTIIDARGAVGETPHVFIKPTKCERVTVRVEPASETPETDAIYEKYFANMPRMLKHLLSLARSFESRLTRALAERDAANEVLAAWQAIDNLDEFDDPHNFQPAKNRLDAAWTKHKRLNP